MAVSAGRARPWGRSDNTDHFRSVFRRHIFALLERGYRRIDSAKCQAWEEPDITGELRVAIQQVLEDRTSPPPRWARLFFVRDEVPVPSPSRKGKRRKVIDLQFEYSAAHARPRFDIEAKRLSKGNRGVAEYLGAEGLEEFITGNYACGDPDGAMLGYVQTGTSEDWAGKIETGIGKRQSELLVVAGGSWRAEKLASGPQHCYSSIHQRPAIGKPISIYHLLFDFTN